MDNCSTSEAPLRSQSSIGDSTDSDVSSLLNEQAKIHVNPSHSRVRFKTVFPNLFFLVAHFWCKKISGPHKYK